MQHAKIIPIDRKRPAPTLFGVSRFRLEAARHQAANRATVALLGHKVVTARQWMRIVDALDETLATDGAA